MQTLIIGSPLLKQEIEGSLDIPGTVTWAHGLGVALNHLEISEVDLVIFDGRTKLLDPQIDLKSLIAEIPVTTRVLAIVERLPVDDIFAQSGVVYLTPPVNLEDIKWFMRSRQNVC